MSLVNIYYTISKVKVCCCCCCFLKNFEPKCSILERLNYHFKPPGDSKGPPHFRLALYCMRSDDTGGGGVFTGHLSYERYFANALRQSECETTCRGVSPPLIWSGVFFDTSHTHLLNTTSRLSQNLLCDLLLALQPIRTPASLSTPVKRKYES